ncbi:hypothetical protein BOX15_Mlig019280g1, partial [Macrostomum lignano]
SASKMSHWDLTVHISRALQNSSALSYSLLLAASVVGAWILFQRRGRQGHVISASSVKKAVLSSSSQMSLRSPTTRKAMLPTTSCTSTANGSVDETFNKVRVFYASQLGRAKHFATLLRDELAGVLKQQKQQQQQSQCCNGGDGEACKSTTVSSSDSAGIELIDLANYDPEESPHKESPDTLCYFLLPTYEGGSSPNTGAWFCKWLAEAAEDWRVERGHLSGLRFIVIGLGNSLYAENYNLIAKRVDEQLTQLSGTRLRPPVLLDENVASATGHGGQEADFQAALQSQLLDPLVSKKKKSACCSEATGNSACCQGAEAASDVAEDHSDVDSDHLDEEDQDGLVDVEDIGGVLSSATRSNQKQKLRQEATTRRAMVTPLVRKSLEKQGYRLIGSHSGVKLCRWTKSMLRGRGGCYKHAFYGIASHRCMEATPSLACANKCVFCWRHHTNPVGTEWRWLEDPPDEILSGALDAHRRMIREFRGVPGVMPERISEGMQPRHCALSLVGEPIMYPRINQLLHLLHTSGISSFLVTNAQFPEAMRQLPPVTQLYVSVDAATPDSLKRIDRPLFKDFWQRFIDCLRAMRDCGQRTVYRLTLVKAWNTEKVQQYAKLVDLGCPDFIEVKGVTFCGDSKASQLTMGNVPWHKEVVQFSQALADSLANQYDIACEHEHSNCVLLANKRKFLVNNRWHTWIDYDRFEQLYGRFVETGQRFNAADYMAETPEWAVYGSAEQGFDPNETRFRRRAAAAAAAASGDY